MTRMTRMPRMTSGDASIGGLLARVVLEERVGCVCGLIGLTGELRVVRVDAVIFRGAG